MEGKRDGSGEPNGGDRLGRAPVRCSGPAQIGRWLCLAGAAIGAVGLLAEGVSARSLTAIVPGARPMMPMTALGLFLLGAAGALRCREDAGRLQRSLSTVAALAVLAIGSGAIAERVLGIDLALDRLVVRSQTDLLDGRPSPVAAVGLTCLAAAVLVFDQRRSARVRPSELLALAAATIALVALLGVVFGVGMVARLGEAPLIGGSLASGMGLLVISLGLLLERPAAGIMQVATSPGPGGIQLRRLLVPGILIPPLLALAVAYLLRGLGTRDLAVVAAVLVTGVILLGLSVLVFTAIPLNRSHRALELSRARFQMLIDQAPEGVFVADLDGRYTEVNLAGCRMVGYTRDELVGRTIVDLLRPEDVERLWQARERLRQGQPEVEEWLLRRKDGGHVCVEVSAKILPGGQWQAFVRDITERKRLEEEQRRARDEIRDSQRRLELALVGADLATWDWNITAGEVIFNARWAEMRGYRLEEVRPHVESWSAGIFPEDRPRVQKALSEHFAGLTEKYSAEYRVLTRSGEPLWIVDLGKVFARDDRGEPVRMVGVELDVSDHKRLESELQLAEAKSTGILSISADAIISIDRDQRITLFNEGAEKIFGYSRSEAIGAPLDRLIPERFRALHRQHVERFAAGGQGARRMGERGASIVGLRKNGEEFPADAAISSLDVAGSKILTVALRDITEQTQLESEQRLLAELGSILVSTVDQATLRAMAEVIVGHLGDVCLVEAFETRGQSHLVVVRHRDPGQSGLAARLERLHLQSPTLPSPPLLARGLEPKDLDSMGGTDEHRQALREIGAKSIMAVPLVAREEVLGALFVLRTTGDWPYFERDQRLLERVANRAALALEKSRLYRLAQQAVQTRDDVLGIVAHDLRNPLGAILVQTGILRHRDRDQPACGSRRPEDVIERAARRMNRLIEDLLDVARIDAGRLSLEPARISVRQLAADVVAAQESLTVAASLELRLDLPPDLPEAWADRDRLVQVFENLIGNAIKCTRAGGNITVGAAAENGDIVFRVSDTGTGIAAEDLPHLFERFWQARQSGRSGAGLGLPIVKGIVDAHGGRVWVESRLGEGTTFFFTIPVARMADAGSPQAGEAATVPGQPMVR